jgi:hypothetical protein
MGRSKLTVGYNACVLKFLINVTVFAGEMFTN